MALACRTSTQHDEASAPLPQLCADLFSCFDPEQKQKCDGASRHPCRRCELYGLRCVRFLPPFLAFLNCADPPAPSQLRVPWRRSPSVGGASCTSGTCVRGRRCFVRTVGASRRRRKRERGRRSSATGHGRSSRFDRSRTRSRSSSRRTPFLLLFRPSIDTQLSFHLDFRSSRRFLRLRPCRCRTPCRDKPAAGPCLDDGADAGGRGGG